MRENLMHSLVNRYPLALLLSEGKIPLEFREIFRHIADCKKTATLAINTTMTTNNSQSMEDEKTTPYSSKEKKNDRKKKDSIQTS